MCEKGEFYRKVDDSLIGQRIEKGMLPEKMKKPLLVNVLLKRFLDKLKKAGIDTTYYYEKQSCLIVYLVKMLLILKQVKFLLNKVKFLLKSIMNSLKNLKILNLILLHLLAMFSNQLLQ